MANCAWAADIGPIVASVFCLPLCNGRNHCKLRIGKLCGEPYGHVYACHISAANMANENVPRHHLLSIYFGINWNGIGCAVFAYEPCRRRYDTVTTHLLSAGIEPH